MTRLYNTVNVKHVDRGTQLANQDQRQLLPAARWPLHWATSCLVKIQLRPQQRHSACFSFSPQWGLSFSEFSSSVDGGSWLGFKVPFGTKMQWLYQQYHAQTQLSLSYISQLNCKVFVLYFSFPPCTSHTLQVVSTKQILAEFNEWAKRKSINAFLHVNLLSTTKSCQFTRE